MRGYIQGIDWTDIEPMKYWAYPASYSADKKRREIKEMILSGDYIGSLKIDGYYQRIVKDEDGNCFMISRSRGVNGEYANKIDWVPHLHPWFSLLPNGTCLLCECFLLDNEGSKNTTRILGCTQQEAVARQERDENKLHLYIYDVMAFYDVLFYDEPFEERYRMVARVRDAVGKPNPFIHYAKYRSGEDLWNYLQEVLDEGREGIVMTHRLAKACEGRTPARQSIKVKREIRETIDCVVMGTNPPEVNYTGEHIESWKYFCNKDTMERLPDGTYHGQDDVIPVTRSYYKGLAGSLKLGLYKDGELTHFGDLSGLPDDVLSQADMFVGKVCEVNGMDIDNESGHIRHPRFVQWRTDKSPEECVWAQVKQ